MALAIIGGTGLEETAGNLSDRTEEQIATPYGQVLLTSGSLNGTPVVFLPRHGPEHESAPHKINYRANIYALKEKGVTGILAAAAVGSLKDDFAPGDFVLLDQFLDFTKNRLSTFFDEGKIVRHTDMTEPFAGSLRLALLRAAADLGTRIHPEGTYVCTEGPRFETPAEIRMFKILGADVVGMTVVPEVVLANELTIPYACVSVVTNMAAGIAGHNLTFEECDDVMAGRRDSLMGLLTAAAVIIGAGNG